MHSSDLTEDTMPGPEDRVTALETTVKELSDRLTMEAGLAASRDRDISEIKLTLGVHGRLLQALAETQADHGRMLTDHGRILADHGRILADHTQLLTELRADVTELKQGMGTIVTMLTTLIERNPD